MKLQTQQLTLTLFEEQYRDALKRFKLTDEQMQYTSLPLEVLDDGLFDHNRRPCVALNESQEVVGFFVLHQYYQHEGYETPINAVYVRSLSVNNALQGRGYGTELMMNIPEFVQLVFPEFDHLYLVVDAANDAAWNVYERAGFIHLATNPEGPVGKERLYYLDLDKDYVSQLKLVEGDDIDLLLDGEKIGFVKVDVNGDTLTIKHFETTKSVKGLKESFIRQIATFVRKHYALVNQITVETVDEQIQSIYLKNNFVVMDSDNPNCLTKLIRY